MKSKINITLIQHSFKGNLNKTLEYVEDEIQKAASMGADIISLQELFFLPYFCNKVDDCNFKYAILKDDEIVKRFQSLAKKNEIVLIFPFFEKRMDGVYNNSALVIDADGTIIDIYRKQHIPDDPSFHEKFYFSQDDSGFKIFECKFGKIAVLICWDQWFPEAARIVTLMGAEIIFYPTAIGILPGEESLKSKYVDAWKTMGKAAAIANGVFVAMVNRVGQEGNINFWGESFICDPFGLVLESAGDDEKILSSTIDKKLIEETRIIWPFLRDRRIDSYKDILKRIIE